MRTISVAGRDIPIRAISAEAVEMLLQELANQIADTTAERDRMEQLGTWAQGLLSAEIEMASATYADVLEELRDRWNDLHGCAAERLGALVWVLNITECVVRKDGKE